MSLALPWEVIERVIGHSYDDRRVLLNFSLTCRELYPRSLLHLLADVHFTNRKEIMSFCDLLRVKPHLQPLVRSVGMHPTNFMPDPLLHLLRVPNPPTIKFTGLPFFPSNKHKGPRFILHQSTLTCCHLRGTHIRALELSHLTFATDLEFTRLLSAFANLQNLVCKNTVIEKNVGPHLAVTRQRLFRRLQLRTLDIRECANEVAVVFLVESTQITVETVSLIFRHTKLPSFPQALEWARLRSLTLMSKFDSDEVKGTVEFLRPPHSVPQLEEVTIILLGDIVQAIRKLRKEEWTVPGCLELDRELLRFPRSGITLGSPPHPRRRCFCAEELGRYFPEMGKRNAITVRSDPLATSIGHKLKHTHSFSLADSPDSKWIATGSSDSIIIIWGSDGEVCHEWDAHIDYPREILSLAFSPNSQHLLSLGGDGKVEIWDISQHFVKVGALNVPGSNFRSCAWSPDGSMIAAGSSGDGVCLWDVQTSRLLNELQDEFLGDCPFVLFSPDGRWLAVGAGRCYILNVQSLATVTGRWDIQNAPSGVLHTILGAHRLGMVAFHPDSTRLATESDGKIQIWDVDAGKELLRLKGYGYRTRALAFSPDGVLLLFVSGGDTVEIWDVDSGAKLLSLDGHNKNLVLAACFSPCGRYVASGSWDKTVRLWRIRDGSCVAIFRDHGASVWKVAFSPDGRTLSSAAKDGTVFVRRLRDVIPKEDCL